MLDFWELDADSLPSSSALNQQRQKLKPDALEAVFRLFNSSVTELLPDTLRNDKYRFLAADGSTFTYFSTPSFSPDEYYCSPGNSISGVYSMHFFDIDVRVTLVRSHSRKIPVNPGTYKRFVDQASAFDYIHIIPLEKADMQSVFLSYPKFVPQTIKCLRFP